MWASQLAIILGCQSHCSASGRLRRQNRISVVTVNSLSFTYLDILLLATLEPQHEIFTSIKIIPKN